MWECRVKIRKRKGITEYKGKGRYGDKREKKKEGKGKSRSARGKKIPEKTSKW